MEHKLATDQIKEQAALYALGALSQIEARGFENHLADGCEVCQAEVAEFDSVVGVLGLAAPPASPPANLREKLTARIAKEPRSAVSHRPIPGKTRREPMARLGGRSAWVTALPWAVAASLAIVAVSSVINLRRAARMVTIAEQQITQMHLDYLHVREELAESQVLNGQNLQIIRVLEKPGSTHIFLAQNSTQPSKANVYWDRQDNKWLVSADMSPAPPGKVYQLWFIAPGPKSAGLIPTLPDGHGFVTIDVPADIGKINAAAITLEPEGGSTQPTMPILAMGNTD
jgi:anti-sigma-K factor RskA